MSTGHPHSPVSMSTHMVTRSVGTHIATVPPTQNWSLADQFNHRTPNVRASSQGWIFSDKAQNKFNSR